MAEFINTVDVLGDDAVMDSIINRTITEFNDDTIETVGVNAFRGCTALTSADLPNCKSLGSGAFNGCTALTSFNFESLTNSIGDGVFGGALNGAEVYLPNDISWVTYNAFNGARFASFYAPNLTKMAMGCFSDNPNLVKLELPACVHLDNNAIARCTRLKYIDIDGSNAVNFNSFLDKRLPVKSFVIRATNGAKAMNHAAVDPDCIFYVPRALIEDYKVATNWVNYADNFRALEDHTVDGSTTGEVHIAYIDYTLRGVISSNMSTQTGFSYRTTLTGANGHSVADVVVTMGGVDVTPSVYNSSTGEVVIDTVTDDITIGAKIAVFFELNS